MKHLSAGPELPYGITMSAMSTSPYGNGVILVGGMGMPSSTWRLQGPGNDYYLGGSLDKVTFLLAVSDSHIAS